MTDNTKNRLVALLSELEALHCDSDAAKVSIIINTGLDEAVAVGTQSGFIRFASEIVSAMVESLDDGALRMKINDSSYPNVTFGKSMDHTAEVVIRSLVVPDCDKGVRNVVKTLGD